MKVLLVVLFALAAVSASAENGQTISKNTNPYSYKSELAKKPDASIGMSQDDILNKTSFGIPVDILTTDTARERLEQWVYEGRKYLYFSNGKLIKIQK